VINGELGEQLVRVGKMLKEDKARKEQLKKKQQ
jgi:hypothetical protein